jgi:hypothetical protein
MGVTSLCSCVARSEHTVQLCQTGKPLSAFGQCWQQFSIQLLSTSIWQHFELSLLTNAQPSSKGCVTWLVLPRASTHFVCDVVVTQLRS